MLPNTTLDRQLLIVQREDGFERRFVRRCERCGTALGYEIAGASEEAGAVAERGHRGVVYLLEAGLRTTEALVASKPA